MNVLFIDDEPKLVKSLKRGLEDLNIEVDFAYDGQIGSRLAAKGRYDVIVCDVIMPNMNGLELCRRLREQKINTPFIFLSALGQVEDRVAGLESGADDYLTKPFEFVELLARIKALARRRREQFQFESVLSFLDFNMNINTKECKRAGITIELTAKEFALMEYLIRNQGRVISKVEIAEKVWGIDFDITTNVIEVYVNYLRNKVDKPFEKKLIHTVFKMGYILKEQP